MNLIKEARQAIKTALVKVAMPLIYKAESADDYQIVYRIENSQGDGPNNPFIWESDEDFQVYEKSMQTRKLPSFSKDQGFDKEDRKMLIEPYLFGFKDMEQFNNWHSSLEIDLLKKNGFSLVKRPASEIRDSGRQIIFLPFVEDGYAVRHTDES